MNNQVTDSTFIEPYQDWQVSGVVKSLIEDKDFVQIWDITSSAKFSKRHLTERKKFYNEARYPYTIEKVRW